MSARDWLWTVLLAMAPVSELRGAIPLALAKGAPWPLVYAVCVVANFVAVVPVLFLVGPLSERLRRIPVMDRFFTWLFARTRRKGRLVERFEAVGLALFVAVPLPVTGGWTGAVAAFVFGVRRRLALAALLAGIAIAGAVVTAAARGVIHVFGG